MKYQKISKIFLLIVISFVFALQLMGCANKEIIPITKVIELRPPEHVSKPTPVPAWQGTTNQDLIEYVLELKEALNMCNADKVGIGAF